MSDGHRIGKPVQACPANPLETPEQRDFPSHLWQCVTVQVYPQIIHETCVYCGAEKTLGAPKDDLTPRITPGYWQTLAKEAREMKELE